jgi:hypothetical protein
MRGSFSAQASRAGSRHRAYTAPDTSSVQEPSVYHGKMRPAPENSTPPVDIVLGVSVETVHALTVHQQKMVFQSPVGLMKEVVWNHSEKAVHFVLDDGSTSPTFVFPVLTELEAHVTAILALPDLEKPPEQVYIGVLIGQNLPSPIQQRRASLGASQPAMLPMAKRRELLRREQPVRNATSRERLGVEYMRSGHLCFTCSISGDLRGLTLGLRHLRVFPSPDCHDRTACLFSYPYDNLESCEVAGTRLELRFRTTHQLAKQPGYLVFQSLEAQYIREAVWFLKNGTYMDASLREMLASPARPARAGAGSTDAPVSPRASVLMFFTDADSLKQRIDSCCRVIGCQHLVESSDRSGRQDEASLSNVLAHINSDELSHMNPSLRTNPSASRVLTHGLCEFHAACLSCAPGESLTRQRSVLARDKLPLPAKTMQPLLALLQSAHYTTMFKFQGQLLKRQNARTFHLRKAWHQKLVALFETPVGGFLCYYDKLSHCPGMADAPKERRVIDLSSVLCIRPVSTASPVTRSAGTPTIHAFDVVTLYRTWTFAAVEPEEYEVWLHVLTECVEKHATIAPDRILRFPVKLAMTGQSSSSEATSLEISSHGVAFCTGHEAEVVLSTWYYTDLEKWSVVFQQGYTCCLLKCRSPAPASLGSPRVAASETVTQEYLFRTADASTICLAIEFYVGKCMAKLEILAGQYLEEQKSKASVADPAASKRGSSGLKLGLQAAKEHPIENVSLAPVGSPEKATTRMAELPKDAEPTQQDDGVEVAGPLGSAVELLPLPVEDEAKEDQHAMDEPLLDLEGPAQEAGALVSIDDSAQDEMPSFKAAAAMVEMRSEELPPLPQTKGQREEDTPPEEAAAEVGQLESSSEERGGLECIALDENTASKPDDQDSAAQSLLSPQEPTDAPKDDCTVEAPSSVTTSSEWIEVDTCHPGQAIAPASVEAAAELQSADVCMVAFQADISSAGACPSTTYEAPTEAASSPPEEPGESAPNAPGPPPAPLLLLEYTPSWTGEPRPRPKQNDVVDEEPDHSTRQDEIVGDEVDPTPPQVDAQEDRASDCEVSDQSDAFNSCASEVELLADDAACLPQASAADCSDELFEDAIDTELLPALAVQLQVPSPTARIDDQLA